MSDLLEEALAYLHSHHVMSLATQGQAGVWAAAVFYAAEHFELTFLSDPQTRHAQNIASHPRAAATIQENYVDWTKIKGIQLEGPVQLLHGAAREQAIAAYLNRFQFLADAPRAIQEALDNVAWYRIIPDRLYFLDNSRGFGHRDRVI